MKVEHFCGSVAYIWLSDRCRDGAIYPDVARGAFIEKIYGKRLREQ
jgi:hypothetical protein